MGNEKNFLLDDAIAVWGPTQSGKDWLYKGFAKELEYFDSRSTGFRFELSEQGLGDDEYKPIIATPPDEDATPPTTEGQTFKHRFTRKPIQDDEAHRLSARTHNMTLYNNAGRRLLMGLENQSEFEDAFWPIIKSQFLLLTLDPVFGDPHAVNIRFSDLAQQPGLNKEQYYQALSRLLQILESKKNTSNAKSSFKQYLAVCITKKDALKVDHDKPWLLLEMVFGQKIYNLFSDYRTTFNIEVFATSAAGYIQTENGNLPNFQDGGLSNRARWKPKDCAAPFFWIFQNREREWLRATSSFLTRDSNLRKYIPYPQARNL